MTSANDDWKSVEEARALPGLRLVLTRGVPGPWGETAKGVLHVKKLPYVRVAQEGGGENPALLDWTGQAAAPVAVFEDERPRAGRNEILFLAERLAPQPTLVPDDPEMAAEVLGLAEIIAGENGFGWCRRLMMVHQLMAIADLPEPTRSVRNRLGSRYGWSAEAGEAAPARAAGILGAVARRLHRQAEAGSMFLVGDTVSFADIVWAAFAALVEPLPADLCPMPDGMRPMYAIADPVLRQAVDPILLEHRDRTYERFLELPIRL